MIGTTINTVYKDGIELRKGVTLTQDFLSDNEELVKKWLNLWLLYPDLFLDSIHDPDDHFTFFYYQRIALRANMRYESHFWTATRGSAKSFLSYLSGLLKCIFLPNTTQIIVSDVKQTVIQTATQKFNEIWQHWPLLRKELQNRADDGAQGEKKSNDYYELWFKNGSHLTVISKDTSRGLRATSAILEECALIDEQNYNAVILPQMNVPRRDPSGVPNPEEPFATQSFITTASDKSCFMYGKLIELAVKSIINHKSAFVWGISYEVPTKYGYLSKSFLDEQRLSSTYNEQDFARESLSIWVGGSSNAWLNSEVIEKCRKTLYCERRGMLHNDEFYIIGADIGRLKCNTVITVCKVMPQEMYFKKKIVYIEVINGENFVSDQAPRIKELIEIYNPREVVIDANGLGIGLIDAMTLPTLNQKNGKLYPPYYTFNLDAHLPPGKSNVSDAPWPQLNAIIYGLKANASNDSDIHANLYAQINNGTLSLLAPERIVRQKLLMTKKGMSMSNYEIRKYLLPYEMTSRLVDELNNLRLKPTGTQNQIKVEQISTATQKDRVSSLEYNLWRVKYYEDELMRRKKRRIGDNKYAFFTPRGGKN